MDLETALKSQDWGLSGYTTRPELDRLMRTHADAVQAKSLWEQYCPWSDSNGGYIKWAMNE
jgi:hypothetical protein